MLNNNYFDIEKYQNKYNNEEIVAKVNIDSTINKLVAQTNNNEYYLKNSLNNIKDNRGNVFLDYRTNLFNKKIILYGHNSKKYEADFKALENYLDYEYYLNHKYIDLRTNYYIRRYEIFSVALYKDDYPYIRVNIDDWSNHLKLLKNKSIYDTGVTVNDENVIILQTCSQVHKDTFIVIIAKEI